MAIGPATVPVVQAPVAQDPGMPSLAGALSSPQMTNLQTPNLGSFMAPWLNMRMQQAMAQNAQNKQQMNAFGPISGSAVQGAGNVTSLPSPDQFGLAGQAGQQSWLGKLATMFGGGGNNGPSDMSGGQ